LSIPGTAIAIETIECFENGAIASGSDNTIENVQIASGEVIDGMTGAFRYQGFANDPFCFQFTLDPGQQPGRATTRCLWIEYQQEIHQGYP
jgi:hypothetical protein